jgi:hypothetical protein
MCQLLCISGIAAPSDCGVVCLSNCLWLLRHHMACSSGITIVLSLRTGWLPTCALFSPGIASGTYVIFVYCFLIILACLQLVELDRAWFANSASDSVAESEAVFEVKPSSVTISTSHSLTFTSHFQSLCLEHETSV